MPRRFTALTGVLVCQGYGMTEASPVTHVGYLQPELYRPDSIGQPLAKTDCLVVGDQGQELPPNQPGELVMRGPQFMLGYWHEPNATAGVLRDGWYWSGDIVSRDKDGFYVVLDRRKEMIKYKGFQVAPAEVEAVLLEHPAVRECGVVGRSDAAAGEVPVAFVALRDGFVSGSRLGEELCAFVAERITSYKQPREVRFVDAVPKTASGKILRGNCARRFRRGRWATGDRNAFVSWKYLCFSSHSWRQERFVLGRLASLGHKARSIFLRWLAKGRRRAGFRW